MRAPAGFALATLVASIVSAGAAHALPFRCGTEVISMGDTKYQVAEACGEPDAAAIDKWIYDDGPDGMINIVYFVNDEVSRIEQEPRPN
ncbi:MAG TPA: DUF2845 domain-containing protein [Steroidobacteraceae bacterium]|nr:DUF2845 domain-containing protein [Steroidobacteraceae bacterium]